MKIIAKVPEHNGIVEVNINDAIVNLSCERSLTEVCEVWPGEEDELRDALEYLKEYLNGK